MDGRWWRCRVRGWRDSRLVEDCWSAARVRLHETGAAMLDSRHVYWIPLYELREPSGFEVVLANLVKHPVTTRHKNTGCSIAAMSWSGSF